MEESDRNEKIKEKNKKYVIMKKIAKHGNQSIIVVPKMLEFVLKPGMITQVTIEVLQTGGQNASNDS